MEGKFPNSDNTRNAQKFEYLGEFEAKIENTLDGYSGALMGSFGQTSLKRKISCMCTFNLELVPVPLPASCIGCIPLPSPFILKGADHKYKNGM